MNDTDKKTTGTSQSTDSDEIIEQTEQLDELELANKKIDELTVAAKQAMADLQNYRKRTEEEKSSFSKFAISNIFSEILPVFDSFERAIQHLPADLTENDWIKGIKNIIRQFEQIIEKFQIKKMETVGKKFDHNLHEAIATAPGEKDIIINELEAGYSMEDYVLRHAKVQVGNGEPQA
ncbi:nucleotide exchange factor GrpE [Patescibacteria group bacterium]|nr:nucleotide exchange factor GrpE [Patescibacteria group bacterium]